MTTMTIQEYKRFAINALKNYSATAALDTDVFLQSVTGLTKTRLILTQRDATLTKSEIDALNKMIELRKSGLAVSYITGEKEFYGNTFIVTRDTLSPRADSETLVECAIDFLKERVKNDTIAPQNITKEEAPDKDPSPTRFFYGASVLDMCTGSACIGLSIAKNAPISRLVLTDISRAALKVAGDNVKKLFGAKNDTKNSASCLKNIPLKIDVLQSDLFEKLQGECFDLIVSNPPYISHNDSVKLLKDGRGDPITALDGDKDGSNDGLYYVRRILQESRGHLSAHGGLFIECADDNIKEAYRYAKTLGYKNVTLIKDLAGCDRVIGAFM